MTEFVDENDPNYNFKGWRFYFNSYTLRGRFNTVVATYGTIIGIFVLYKLRKWSKQSAIEEDATEAKKKK